MKGGVILFRGTGAAARRYLEADRSTADEYYLEGGTALAEFTVSDPASEVIEARTLDPEQYAAWVDWTDPISGTSMGTPRGAGLGLCALSRSFAAPRPRSGATTPRRSELESRSSLSISSVLQSARCLSSLSRDGGRTR